jgi:hypothetical protein
MKNKIFLLIFLFCPLLLLGQENSWDGCGITPNSKLRVLNIFINVIYDVHPDTNDMDDEGYWDHATIEGVNNQSIPTYLLDFMDTVFVAGQTHGCMTRVYAESSFDSLQVIGDFMVVNVKESSVLAIGSFSAGNIVNAAVQIINAQGGLHTLYGRNSLADYDYKQNERIYYTQMLIRNISREYGGLCSGCGRSGTTSYKILINNNLVDLSHGTIQNIGQGNLAENPTSIVAHEISHSLFGSNNMHTSGGNHRGSGGFHMSFLTVQGGYGLMGAANAGLVSCNGYERWRVHWKHPLAPGYITARNTANNSYLHSDITKEDGNISFRLRDFVTHGDAVRIKLPYKDSPSASNQYIWLENHQVGLNGKLDFLQYSNVFNCRPHGLSGIYAYYQVGNDVLSGSSSDVWPAHERDNLKIIPAEGYYDYSLQTESYNFACVAYNNMDYAIVRGDANPFCGAQDQETQLFSNHTNANTIDISHAQAMFRKKIGNQVFDGLSALGDNNDAFIIYTKINMSTNPSTCNTKTYYNCMDVLVPYNDFTSQIYRNNQTTYLTGLSIEMIPAPNHDFLVHVRWDDYNITNNARWTGKIALKEQAILTRDHHIVLTQNYTVAQPFRDTESGVFAAPTLFTCEGGSIFTQQPQTSVTLEKRSKMVLDSNSFYTLGDSAQMVVMERCTLLVQKGAHFSMGNMAKIIVDSAGTVILHDTVKCHVGASILVKPGGKLVLDGATLTHACPDMLWEGIRVEGNSNQRQLAQYQGVLEIKNGTVIEHARVAVGTGTYEDAQNYWTSFGGMIIASNSTFRNNRKAVGFMSYTNHDASGAVADNASYFTNCSFLLDNNNVFANVNASPMPHVTLWDVRGIRFNGCTFANTSNYTATKGIYAEDGGFKINYSCPSGNILSPCQECPTYTRTAFDGFSTAIEAATTGNNYAINIDHSLFKNIAENGVKLTATHNFKIVRSDFNLTDGGIYQTGLSVNNATGYKIEQNNFFNDIACTSFFCLNSEYGIKVNNSGTANNLIYRNQFHKLIHGIYAIAINGKYSPTSGLEFQCNTFNQNKTDFYVASGGIVNPWQGSPSKGADNTFANTLNSSLSSQSSGVITYHHSAGSTKVPYNPTSSNVSVMNTASTNNCEQTICMSFIALSSNDMQLSAYNNLKNNYNSLLVEAEAGGYEQILQQAGNGEYVNPDAWEAAMQNKENQNNISREMSILSQTMIDFLLSDTVQHLAELRQWFEAMPVPAAKYALAESYMQTGDYSSANNILLQIPASFDFSEQEMIEHENYMQFTNLKANIYNTSRTWYQLTESEISELQDIAKVSGGRSSAMARGALCFFYEICEDNLAFETQNAGNHDTKSKKGIAAFSNSSSTVSIYPSPVSDELTIETGTLKVKNVEIIDLAGKTMLNIPGSTKETPAQTINVSRLSSGMYFARIYLNNNEIIIKKIVKE